MCDFRKTVTSSKSRAPGGHVFWQIKILLCEKTKLFIQQIGRLISRFLCPNIPYFLWTVYSQNFHLGRKLPPQWDLQWQIMFYASTDGWQQNVNSIMVVLKTASFITATWTGGPWIAHLSHGSWEDDVERQIWFSSSINIFIYQITLPRLGVK